MGGAGLSATVEKIKDFISISTSQLGEQSLNADFTEATEIRDGLMRLFPPSLKEVSRIYGEADEQQTI